SRVDSSGSCPQPLIFSHRHAHRGFHPFCCSLWLSSDLLLPPLFLFALPQLQTLVFPNSRHRLSPTPDTRAAKSHYVDRKQPFISHSETKPGFSGCECLELGRWG